MLETVPKLKNTLPTVGKISPEVFDELIFPRLGIRRTEVLTGPRHGVDIGVVDLGDGRVMAATTDPIYIVPQYGWERASWFAWHILVSDVVTSGLSPTYLIPDFNLPMDVDENALSVLWHVFHRESCIYGASIIAGHTARYPTCTYPMVGGATVLAIGSQNEYVTPEMAMVGDDVVLTKGAAIEATGLFAATFPHVIVEKFGKDFAKRADCFFDMMSVVDDALIAASVGTRKNGVTAMHDATECGVWGGLFEVAMASGVGMRIDKSKIVVAEEVRTICDHFGMDPYSAISEGTLVATIRPHRTGEVITALAARGIEAAVIGTVVEKEKGMILIDGSRESELVHPRVDPFWTAFDEALRLYA
jgi:hydrogenase expression/formation protein HypE